MRSTGIKGNSPKEIESALQHAIPIPISEELFRPPLAICFLSVKQDRRAICKLPEEENIAIFGATNHGEFVDEEISKGSVVGSMIPPTAVIWEEQPAVTSKCTMVLLV